MYRDKVNERILLMFVTSHRLAAARLRSAHTRPYGLGVLDHSLRLALRGLGDYCQAVVVVPPPPPASSEEK